MIHRNHIIVDNLSIHKSNQNLYWPEAHVWHDSDKEQNVKITKMNLLFLHTRKREGKAHYWGPFVSWVRTAGSSSTTKSFVLHWKTNESFI